MSITSSNFPKKTCSYISIGVGCKVTPHYFRHRFFTECGKANVPMVDVKAISGIKDNNVLLQHYLHSTVEGQDKVLAVTGL